MFRFSDSFKSYYDRRFCDSRGRAIYVPSLSRVWLPNPATITPFLGLTFINLWISNQVTIFTLPSREASHHEHLHKRLALFLRETLKRLLNSVVSDLRTFGGQSL